MVGEGSLDSALVRQVTSHPLMGLTRGRSLAEVLAGGFCHRFEGFAIDLSAGFLSTLHAPVRVLGVAFAGWTVYVVDPDLLCVDSTSNAQSSKVR